MYWACLKSDDLNSTYTADALHISPDQSRFGALINTTAEPGQADFWSVQNHLVGLWERFMCLGLLGKSGNDITPTSSLGMSSLPAAA